MTDLDELYAPERPPPLHVHLDRGARTMFEAAANEAGLDYTAFANEWLKAVTDPENADKTIRELQAPTIKAGQILMASRRRRRK